MYQHDKRKAATTFQPYYVYPRAGNQGVVERTFCPNASCPNRPVPPNQKL